MSKLWTVVALEMIAEELKAVAEELTAVAEEQKAVVVVEQGPFP